MTWQPDSSDEPGIARLEGTPHDPWQQGESTRFRRFLRFIWPFAKKGGKWAVFGADLAKQYGAAEVSEKQHRAAVVAAEAAEAAAKADVARQGVVVSFGDAIDDIFADPDQPESVKYLKLGKLLEQNPGLEAQAERIQALLEKLALTRGTSIQLKPSLAPDRALPSAPEGTKSQSE